MLCRGIGLVEIILPPAERQPIFNCKAARVVIICGDAANFWQRDWWGALAEII